MKLKMIWMDNPLSEETFMPLRCWSNENYTSLWLLYLFMRSLLRPELFLQSLQRFSTGTLFSLLFALGSLRALRHFAYLH